MRSSDVSAKNLMQPAYSVSHKVVKKKSVLIMTGTSWKYILNLVKDTSTIYLNFITTDNIVAEQKERRI